MKQLGQQRGVGMVIVLYIVTFGIYGIFWIYKCFGELKRYRGTGVGGFVGLLSCLVIVGIFLLPAYVGRMYREDGKEPPITGLGGFWTFIPYLGGFIWAAKIQGGLNTFWESKASMSAAAAAPVADPA